MEPKNVKINMMVTPSIWNYLQKKENYSDYIRELIEKDRALMKKRGLNKTLV